MNTSPIAKTILCYGDSNTFGQRSDDVHKGRWPADVRWTGQLQSLLGNTYYIIEEGLSSRTTDLEYDKKPGRNGKSYLIPCLQSHSPIDLVISMLGTNDLKDIFQRSAKDVAEAMGGMIDDIRAYAPAAKIMLVSPIQINDKAEHFTTLYVHNYSVESVQKSQELAAQMELVARQKECLFFDAASVAEPGEDGLHFSRKSHDTFAKAMAERVVTGV